MKKGVAVAVTLTAAIGAAIVIQPRLGEPQRSGRTKPPTSAPAAQREDKEKPQKRQVPRRVDKDDAEEAKDARERGPRTLQLGVRGSDVRALQEALAQATYDPGAMDGEYGYMTQHAVLAFEKVNGLELDGTVTPKEQRLIAKATAPRPPQRTEGTYVDVDITRQVLFEVKDGEVVHTLPVSTANGETYQSRSGLATAYTPRGEFTIYSKTPGWRISYLGGLYNPSYFTGGYAIHGSASVPPYPASHGCVRIPMHSADAFYERNPIGTPVFVHD